jgi:ATP-dependent helicase IRC3
MVKIEINNNNTYKLHGKLKFLTKLYKKFKVKHPNAFYLRRGGYMPRGWDGCIDYITDNLTFKAGLLQMIVKEIHNMGEKVEIIDNRLDFNVKPKLVEYVGEHKMRPEQTQALKALLHNEVANIKHYIAVYDAATNFGKTTLMASIYHAFRRKIPTIVLLKDGDLFEQFKQELPKLIPKEDLGFVRNKNMDFKNFTVVMVQSLAPKVSMYKNTLAKYGIALVDEADEGDSKTYKKILTNLYNCKVRVGLSGTIYMSKYKKDEMKNMNLRSFFGDVIYKITKKEMVEKGYSTPVVIRLYPGSTLPPLGLYPEEYDINITKNKARIKLGIHLMKKAEKFKRLPAIVMFRYHDHGILIHKMFKKAFPNLRVELVHGDTKNRKKIISDFREGKIDILVGSYILKRGKNFPTLRYILNMASGDSQETVSQIWGRLERTHENKKKCFMDDFMDEGRYLKRHSKHRRNYYISEGMKVIEYTK